MLSPGLSLLLLAPLCAAAEETAQAEDGQSVESVEDRLARIEAELQALSRITAEQAAEAKETGFLSTLEERLDLGGEVRIDFIDSQREWNPSRPELSSGEDRPYLRIDKVRLSPRVQFTGKTAPIGIVLDADIDFASFGEPAGIKEVFVAFSAYHTEWARSELKIGLDDPFMRLDRNTGFWAIPATAFWRREHLGMFWESKLWSPKDAQGRFGAYASLTNGFEFDRREPGKDEDVFEMLAYDPRLGSGETELREYGVGVGWDKRWYETSGWRVQSEILGFYYNDSMGGDDDDFLRENFLDVDSNIVWTGDPADLVLRTIHGRERWGANAVLEIADLMLIANFTHGRDGKIDRETGYVEALYRIEFDRPLLLDRYVRSVTPIARYEWLNTNLPRVPTNSLTWDRTRWLPGLMIEVWKNIYLRAEYAFNQEETAGGDPDTDEFLVQLELNF